MFRNASFEMTSSSMKECFLRNVNEKQNDRLVELVAAPPFSQGEIAFNLHGRPICATTLILCDFVFANTQQQSERIAFANFINDGLLFRTIQRLKCECWTTSSTLSQIFVTSSTTETATWWDVRRIARLSPLTEVNLGNFLCCFFPLHSSLFLLLSLSSSYSLSPYSLS